MKGRSNVGKYSSVIDRLPRLISAETIGYQEKVKTTKAALVAEGQEMHAAALAQRYTALRDEKEEAEAAVSAVNLRLEAVSQLMAAQFEAEGVASLKLADRSVSIYLEPYSQVLDKEAFRIWCVEQGLERQMALPWQATNSLTKQRLLDGEPEPPGVVVYAKTKIMMRQT